MGLEVEHSKKRLANANYINGLDPDSAGMEVPDSGQVRLEALGYRQELHRRFNMYTSFASSLVLMANTSGITGVDRKGFHLCCVCQTDPDHGCCTSISSSRR